MFFHIFWSDLLRLEAYLNSSWQPIHVWLVQKRTISRAMMQIATGLTLIIIVSAGGVYVLNPASYPLFYALGVKSASLAVGFFILSLTPGILKRLDILTLPRTSMMLFRRELGDLAFLAGLTHALLVRLLPKFLNPLLIGVIPPLPEIVGFLVLLVLIPLYATSNDLMVAKLGVWWSRIHRLTYLVLGLLIVHTAWFSFSTAFLLALVGIMEIASYTKPIWTKYLPSVGKTP